MINDSQETGVGGGKEIQWIYNFIFKIYLPIFEKVKQIWYKIYMQLKGNELKHCPTHICYMNHIMNIVHILYQVLCHNNIIPQ